jgi:WD40 repeat protein
MNICLTCTTTLLAVLGGSLQAEAPISLKLIFSARSAPDVNIDFCDTGLLLNSSYAREVHLYDTSTGALLGTHKAGKPVVRIAATKTALIYTTLDSRMHQCLFTKGKDPFATSATCMLEQVFDFASNGESLLAYRDAHNEVSVYSISAGKVVARLGKQNGYTRLHFSVDGSELSQIDDRGNVFIYDLGSATERFKLMNGFPRSTDANHLNHIAYSRAGIVAYTVTNGWEDDVLFVKNLPLGQTIYMRRLASHYSGLAVDFKRSSIYYCERNVDREFDLNVVDFKGNRIGKVDTVSQARTLKLSPDGKLLAAIDEKSVVHVFSVDFPS